MATAIAVTPEDVAFELVATKWALIDVLNGIIGTTPNGLTEAATGWADKSPVQLPQDHEYLTRLYERSSELEREMLRGLASFFAAQPDRIEAS